MFIGGTIGVLKILIETLDPYWEGLSVLALIATLVYVIIYANQTKKLVTATKNMATVQLEELGLRKRPVISIHNRNAEEYQFRTKITNLSNVHAKLRVKANIKVDGNVLNIPPDQHYSGNRIWQLQANTSLGGHLSFKEVFSYNKLEISKFEKKESEVSLECWVINFEDDEDGLYDVRNKNPQPYWSWKYWKGAGGVWVPEISPFAANIDLLDLISNSETKEDQASE